MKQRLADYVADFLASHGVTDCFLVTGGGAMHLDDALGHHEKLHCTYNHHELPGDRRRRNAPGRCSGAS